MALPALRRIQENIEADTQLIAQGRLQRSCSSFFEPARGDNVRGAVLMLHGWTAGPWQFVPLAKKLSEAGLHCYAARLPGHGACMQDGSEDSSLLPPGAKGSLYGEAGEAAYQRLAALAEMQAVPLFVFGFSLGGALAVDLVRQHGPQISRLILAAPMLRPRGMNARLSFRAARGLGRLGTGLLFDRIPMSWGARPAANPGDWVRPGHWTFRMGHLFAVMSYTRNVARQIERINVPTQLFLSDADDKSDPRIIEQLLKKSRLKHDVWHFGAALQVPHAMLTPEENPHAPSRDFIYETSLDFLLNGHGRSGRS